MCNGYIIADSSYLSHHGILGMKWGKMNGPPYPLGSGDHSKAEKKVGWRKSLGPGRNEELYGRKNNAKVQNGSKKTNNKDSVKSDKKQLDKKKVVTALKVGAGIAVAAAATYGAYSLYKSGALNEFLDKNKNISDLLLKNKSISDTNVNDIMDNAQKSINDVNVKDLLNKTMNVAKTGSYSGDTKTAVSQIITDGVKNAAKENIDNSKSTDENLIKELPPMTQYMRMDLETEKGKRITSAIIDNFKKGSGLEISKEYAERINETISDFTGAGFEAMRKASQLNAPKPGMFSSDPNVNAEIFKRFSIKSKILNDFIEKSPKYSGTIYRGIAVSENVASKILGDESISMLGPASWSKDRDISEAFASSSLNSTNTVQIMFKLISNKSGVDITNMSEVPYEQEVISPQSAKYIKKSITELKKFGHKYYEVLVEEI